jgi:hypothetical protein
VPIIEEENTETIGISLRMDEVQISIEVTITRRKK